MSDLLPNLHLMTAREKLQAMEELWESMTPTEKEAGVPAWHEEALRETEARYQAGMEIPVPWEQAKEQLRARSAVVC